MAIGDRTHHLVHVAALTGAIGAAFAVGLLGELMTDPSSPGTEQTSPGLAGFLFFWGLAIALIALAIAAGGVVKTAPRALAEGIMTGGLAGILLAVGRFTPFALGVGSRNVEGWQPGMDLPWRDALAVLMVLYGIGGAASGVLSGMAAWALGVMKRRRGGRNGPSLGLELDGAEMMARGGEDRRPPL